jgi:hypothetical protein
VQANLFYATLANYELRGSALEKLIDIIKSHILAERVVTGETGILDNQLPVDNVDAVDC